jgi:hypothetical protein
LEVYKLKKYLLSFEYDSDGEKLEIHANEKGLIYLKEQIEMLLEHKQGIHLMTPSWGGEELTEEKQGKDNTLIHHVKIFHWGN